MRRTAAWIAAASLLAGCASAGPDAAPAGGSCRAEVARLRAQLAAEAAERQKIVRAASRREDALRRQLDAMKAIERGILEREDRLQTEAR